MDKNPNFEMASYKEIVDAFNGNKLILNCLDDQILATVYNEEGYAVTGMGKSFEEAVDNALYNWAYLKRNKDWALLTEPSSKYKEE